MRFSKAFMPTRKEDPADADVVSHKLLVRGGYMRMVARGIYTFMPLGWRSVRKIEAIIRDEMDAAGAQEVHMPMVQPSELWRESGRWTQYGNDLLRFKDRKDTSFCLGPTHEEVITDLVRGELTSYKQLPTNLYQIQTKFRDEPRPRFGLMRGREFVMKDAYSFDLDAEGANASYDIMFDAYSKICDRLGFDWVAVEADTGNIGGSRSHEFQVLADTGEDEIVSCSNCDYAANVEKAEIKVDVEERAADADLSDYETVDTPDAKTIEEVSGFLKRDASDFVKTLLFMADGDALAVLVRGDHDANEIKVKDLLKEEGRELEELRMAGDAEVEEITGAPVGFAGPVGLDIPIYADPAVKAMTNFIVGANEADKHHVGVNWGKDFDVTTWRDLRVATDGDQCGRCGGTFELSRGIEVGHVFYLGTKYSEAMDAKVLDENGKAVPMEMGCYGIGVTRILAAVVEQNHDDWGIKWPMAIAPYHVMVLPLQMNNDAVVAEAERIYEELQAAGIEVLIDDRDERAGSKFKDADLIGIPLRITVGGRGLDEGIVEYKPRGAKDFEKVATGDVVDRAIEYVKSALD